MDKKLKLQKTKDLSFLLPFIGLLLFSPLILATVRAKNVLFNLPSVPLFIFFVCISLIASLYFLSLNLRSIHMDLSKEKSEKLPVKAELDD